MIAICAACAYRLEIRSRWVLVVCDFGGQPSSPWVETFAGSLKPQHRLKQYERRPSRPSLRHVRTEILHRETCRIALQAGIEFGQLIQQEAACGTADVAC